MTTPTTRTDQLGRHALAQLASQILKEKEVYPNDPWSWACEQVVTIDEASQQIRPWPQWEYLHDIFDVLQEPETHIVGIPKSRRMFVSWALATWCVWRARYHEANAILWQSETEDKAALTTDKRMLWLEQHLKTPEFRQQPATIKTTKGMVAQLTYPNGSWIRAVPQGGDVVRAYTPSVLVMDECDFQPQAQQAYTAALPFAEKNAKIILVSSSNGPGHPLANLCKSVGLRRWSPSS
jgi:hypothetical protein